MSNVEYLQTEHSENARIIIHCVFCIDFFFLVFLLYFFISCKLYIVRCTLYSVQCTEAVRYLRISCPIGNWELLNAQLFLGQKRNKLTGCFTYRNYTYLHYTLHAKCTYARCKMNVFFCYCNCCCYWRSKFYNQEFSIILNFF